MKRIFTLRSLFFICVAFFGMQALFAQDAVTGASYVMCITTSQKAKEPVSLRLAAEGGKLAVRIGKGEIQHLEVGTDIKKMEPITLRPELDNAPIAIYGDLLAIDCKNAKLTDVSFIKADKLKLLDLSENQLTKLNIFECKNLEFVYCMNNQLKEFYAGEHNNLGELNLSFNKLSEINLSKFPKLKHFSCDKNKITALNLTKNPLIEELYCKKNKLKELVINNLAKLKGFSCESNELGSIDLSNASLLEKLYAKDNKLESIDLSKSKNLKEINLSQNPIKTLDLAACSELVELYAFEMELQSIDLSQNTKLATLSLGANQLEEIDLQGLPLQEVSLSFNKLKSINLKDCSQLQAIALDHNQLTEVDFSSCLALQMADISFNQFKGEQGLKTVASLVKKEGEDKGILTVQNTASFPEDKEGNVIDQKMAEKAKELGWLLKNGEEDAILANENVCKQSTIKAYQTADHAQLILEGAYLSAVLINTSGLELQKAQKGESFSVGALPSGMYLLKVYLENGKLELVKLLIRH